MFREYKGLKLRLYKSMLEYEQEEGIEHVYVDAAGKELTLKTEDVDFSGTIGKEHFADDSTLVPEKLSWEAFISEPRGIVCVLLREGIVNISFKELLTTCGHELGHLTDGSAFGNATELYETPAGYEQEELRGQAFESFVGDAYEIAKLYMQMFNEVDILVEDAGLVNDIEPSPILKELIAIKFDKYTGNNIIFIPSTGELRVVPKKEDIETVHPGAVIVTRIAEEGFYRP